MIGRAQGKGEGFLSLARRLSSGVPTRLRNPVWDGFLIHHEEVLGLFYPSLYTARVERAIGGISQQQRSSSAVPAVAPP